MNLPLTLADIVGTGNKVMDKVICEKPEITIAEETIDPEQAKIYLENQELNRNVNLMYVRRLLEDMQQGRWVDRGDPVKFNVQGKLIDGQHRLNAVIMSGKPQKFIVIRGYTEESMKVLDIGKSRSSSHVGQIIGLDINAKHTATINCMSLPYKDITRSTPQILEIFREYEDGIRFACRRQTGVEPISPMKALIAKAYYYVDHQRLQEFMQVFSTGFAVEGNSQNEDSAAIALNQNWKGTTKQKHMGWGERSTWYLKCQSSLSSFLKKQQHKVIQMPRTVVDLYPLPTIQTGTEFEKRLKMFNCNKAKRN